VCENVSERYLNTEEEKQKAQACMQGLKKKMLAIKLFIQDMPNLLR
jgi:hypothetical protein